LWNAGNIPQEHVGECKDLENGDKYKEIEEKGQRKSKENERKGFKGEIRGREE